MTVRPTTTLALIATLALAIPGAAFAAAAPGDPAKGEALFKSRCSVCHAVAEAPGVKPGPLLKGVVGRKAAAVPAFRYSAALKKSNLTWDPPTVDKFLTAPAAMVPGTFMVINLPKADERQHVVAYLASLK